MQTQLKQQQTLRLENPPVVKFMGRILYPASRTSKFYSISGKEIILIRIGKISKKNLLSLF